MIISWNCPKKRVCLSCFDPNKLRHWISKKTLSPFEWWRVFFLLFFPQQLTMFPPWKGFSVRCPKKIQFHNMPQNNLSSQVSCRGNTYSKYIWSKHQIFWAWMTLSQKQVEKIMICPKKSWKLLDEKGTICRWNFPKKTEKCWLFEKNVTNTHQNQDTQKISLFWKKGWQEIFKKKMKQRKSRTE